jgi:two-component system LytT family sensor kinase
LRQRAIHTTAVVLAWVPIFFVWLGLTMVYGHMPMAAALPRAGLTIGSAALLAIGVPALCTTMPWPRHVRAGFYAIQLVAASVYSLAWMVAVYAFEPILSGTSMLQAIRSSHVLGWQFIMGFWLYGGIAGIAYAIQTQQRARDQERRALGAEAALVTARLDALRSRLHPHFLFNALHTVTALVRHDATQAENAIERLGDMLRYTLQEKTGHTVPFAEEWDFTQRYLQFEQLRYGDRLGVSSAIDPTCLTCTTPEFALQTLVENAVRHSIDVRPEGGTIEIKARTDDASLYVSVRDDGRNALSATQHGSRFGLKALRERLRSVYGERAQLVIAVDGGGFEASLMIPRALIEDADDD